MKTLKTPETRDEMLSAKFPKMPAFRFKQIALALYDSECESWDGITVLPLEMREKLKDEAWMSFYGEKIFISARRDTVKALLKLKDGLEIETVLMENLRGQFTICVSSQVGCAMACTFCATGKMGLIRSLSSDEIADQYRFWVRFLKNNSEFDKRISNVVFMGMGEPLANYENVKKAINVWLANTDLGYSKITVSSVGLLPVLNKILEDETWPPVRVAISLHSADPVTRKEIVPSSYDGFLDGLAVWGQAYLKKFGNRKHHLTFEYVMLQDINDTPLHAQKLVSFAARLGHVKVNLIPYNFTDLGFQRSVHERTDIFKNLLELGGLTVTVRKTMGDDIAAACGQLITIESSAKVF